MLYASRTDPSITEGATWLAASFIPGIGSYISVAGFFRAADAAILAGDIRKYTDKNQNVHVTLWKDRNYSIGGTFVEYWDGRKETIKPYGVPYPEAQIVHKTVYKSGRLNSGGTWYYLNSNGNKVTSWQSINGVWYYFSGSGVMQTGWVQIGGIWYYLNSSGAMATGSVQINGTWCYFNSSGAWIS